MTMFSKMLQTFLSYFRRKTSSGNYIREIDGLRFIAILAVLLVHVSGIWMAGAERGYESISTIDTFVYQASLLGGYGVEFFFSISGFVLAWPFFQSLLENGKPIDIRKYFIRRLTRLEPPYVLMLIIFFCSAPFFRKETWVELLPHFIASVFYVHNVTYGQGSLINNNAWSLEIEVQFYLLVPVLMSIVKLRPTLRRSLIAGLAVPCMIIASFGPAILQLTLLSYFQFFAVGILICDLWIFDWKNVQSTYANDFVGIASLIGFFATNLAFSRETCVWCNPIWCFGVFYSALFGAVTRKFLSWGVVPIIGGMCYSIYLMHARILSLLLKRMFTQVELTHNFTLDFIFVVAIAVPLCILLSSVFFLLVERPCMDPNWPKKLRSLFLKHTRKNDSDRDSSVSNSNEFLLASGDSSPKV